MPPTSRAPRCASPSIPRAMPLTTTSPAAASSRPSDRATERPYEEHARAPTIATAGRASSSVGASPRSQSVGRWVGDRPEQRRILLAATPDAADAHAAANPDRGAIGERLREVLRQHRVGSRRARRSSSRRGPRARGHGRRAAPARRPDRAARMPPRCGAERRRRAAAPGRRSRARAPRPTPHRAARPAPRLAAAASRRRGRTGRATRATPSRGSAEIRCGLHAQSAAGSPRPPQGQRFIVATRRNRAGKSACPPTRATETTPSSSGWRSDSSTGRGNSGSSSISSTPRWARLASPGRGTAPPPTIAAAEAP